MPSLASRSANVPGSFRSSSFATRWAEYGYGLTLRAEDACTKQAISTAFKASGYNVKQLLIELTQTDAFHYIMVPREE